MRQALSVVEMKTMARRSTPGERWERIPLQNCLRILATLQTLATPTVSTSHQTSGAGGSDTD